MIIARIVISGFNSRKCLGFLKLFTLTKLLSNQMYGNQIKAKEFLLQFLRFLW